MTTTPTPHPDKPNCWITDTGEVWMPEGASAADVLDVLEEVSADRPADRWSELRAERDARLAACDWTQLRDAPVDATAWAAYRQALRDLPELTADPANPVWPEPPA